MTQLELLARALELAWFIVGYVSVLLSAGVFLAVGALGVIARDLRGQPARVGRRR